PAVDEAEIKEGYRAEKLATSECATALAEAKALRIARRHPEALVIGADQLLVCGDAWFDKPSDRSASRPQLLALRGRPHELVTAICVARGSDMLWHHVERPRLVMRAFDEAFLERYLDRCGDDVLGSVGAYRLEGLGIQLFERIDGDFFAILG